MDDQIAAYSKSLSAEEAVICDTLRHVIDKDLPRSSSKIWHGAPVWFLDGNPIVGYSKLKGRVRLLFWSGADFDEPGLQPGTGKFKDAHIDYTDVKQINLMDLTRCLEKAQIIQWNYRDIVKNKGVFEPFTKQ